MKKTFFLLFFLISMGLNMNAQKQNRYRINGIGFESSLIPSKFNTKASSSTFGTPDKSETKIATDLLAAVSLFYSKKINFLITGGWQIHTIQSSTTPFVNNTVSNQSLKLGAGMEYKVWQKNKSALITQGLYMFEVIRDKKSTLQQSLNNSQQTVVLLDYYPGADNFGVRHAAELKLLYDYSINKSTHLRAGCGLSFEFSDKNGKKAYYQGQPDLYFRMLSNATFSYNRESYLFFQIGVFKNITRKNKDVH